MWCLAQEYLAHVHNLCANRKIKWQKPQQVLVVGGSRYFPHPYDCWFELVLHSDSVA
jgi:hypothetical protein